MRKRDFTGKEKIVFYGMIRFPGLNDNALSKIIDINPSTIATIRNKLKKNNFFQTIRIPLLQYCGFELFTVSFDTLYLTGMGESPRTLLGNIYKRIPNVFYLLTGPDSWISLGFYQNYLNLKRINENARYNKFKLNLQEDSEKQIIFPFGLTKFYNYFDYSEIVRNHFEIDNNYFKPPADSNKGQDQEQHQDKYLQNVNQQADSLQNRRYLDNLPAYFRNLQYLDQPLDTIPKIKLTRAEREVLLALVQYPELSDFAINKKISISATSINNIRKKFETRNLIKQCIVPNLYLLGFELFAFMHLKFRSNGNLKAREKLTQNLMSKVPNILYIANNTDEIIFGAYKNFSHYQHINDEITRIYRDKNMLAADIRSLIFPLNDSINHKEHAYVPIINQFLGKEETVISTILEIVGDKLGETGKQILLNQLESLELMPEELTKGDIPKLKSIIQQTFMPVFGKKSVADITKKIEKLVKK